MVDSQNNAGYQKIPIVQSAILLILRLVVGWHLLYEGVAKLLTPGWTSAGYLRYSRWILADFFGWITSNPEILKVVDLLNVWGLILIGLGLMLGCLTRLAAVAVQPKEAFQFAFENGTDFVCVGMFDFQVRDNVRTAKKILAKNVVKNRERPWA